MVHSHFWSLTNTKNNPDPEPHVRHAHTHTHTWRRTESCGVFLLLLCSVIGECRKNPLRLWLRGRVRDPLSVPGTPVPNELQVYQGKLKTDGCCFKSRRFALPTEYIQLVKCVCRCPNPKPPPLANRRQKCVCASLCADIAQTYDHCFMLLCMHSFR